MADYKWEWHGSPKVDPEYLEREKKEAIEMILERDVVMGGPEHVAAFAESLVMSIYNAERKMCGPDPVVYEFKKPGC